MQCPHVNQRQHALQCHGPWMHERDTVLRTRYNDLDVNLSLCGPTSSKIQLGSCLDESILPFRFHQGNPSRDSGARSMDPALSTGSGNCDYHCCTYESSPQQPLRVPNNRLLVGWQHEPVTLGGFGYWTRRRSKTVM